MDRLLAYERLHKRFHSTVREYNRDTSRWLLEGFSDIVRQHEVLATVSVWFKDSARPIEYEYEVGEIIYKIHNSWKIRPLSQRHRLPAEYVPSIVVPSSKIFYRPVC